MAAAPKKQIGKDTVENVLDQIDLVTEELIKIKRSLERLAAGTTSSKQSRTAK